jgi:Family of unknown function (DUF6982)/PilZ domain
MSEMRAGAAAAAKPLSFDVLPTATTCADASDRRAFSRLTPAELQSRLTARHKYGDAVTLVDLSAGGALLETSRPVRPDTDLALEILDAQTQNISQVVSRVLRARVATVNGGITYRAACAFKRPLSHPLLLEATPPVPSGPPPAPAPDFLKLELALKTIVEGYFKRPAGFGSAGRWRDATSLIQALIRLRAASERRRDPVDRQLAQFLATLIPALQRYEPVDAVIAQLQEHVAEHLPVLSIRPGDHGAAVQHDRERVTLNMAADSGMVPIAVTAEFPVGFCLDAGQFRLLKMTAYLVGLAGNWATAASQAAAAAPSPAAADREPVVRNPDPVSAGPDDLPLGWNRIVVRYVDGPVLRGYSNDFHPARAHLHLCPSVNCAAAERLLVPVSRLKAVFFVRTLEGDRERVDDQTFDEAPRGRKVQVTFRDGEVVVGTTLNYKPEAHGFFLRPANARGNNTRIYIVTPAIRHMRFI